MSASQTFSAWIARKRKDAQESYQTLASRADVSVATVFATERGDTSPSLDTAEKLASAYGTSLEAALRVRNKKIAGPQLPVEGS
jgi:transcriptional regulator with XRE-family HTH domain